MPRNLRDRGRDLNGHRWCDDNYDIKKELMAKSGGVMPFTPAFTTSPFEGSLDWSEDNPPDILFYLTPPTPTYAAYEPQHVLDENCKAIMSPRKQNQELRSIPILPDRISLSVPGWMMVAWRRIDPRISLQDIVDRMTADLGRAQKLTAKTATIPNKNILQNHCNRNCSKILRYYNAYARRKEPHRAEVEAVEGLSLNNIRFNTTLNCHPEFKDRLVKVKFVRKQGDGKMYIEELKVTKENLAETTYPIDHFLFDGYEPVVSESMEKALQILYIVQERALLHNMQASDWRKLARTCLPSTWFDRTHDKPYANQTYDGGCRICSWAGTRAEEQKQVDFVPTTPKSSFAQPSDSDIEDRIQKSGYTAAEYWISDEDDYKVQPSTSFGPGNTTTALQKRESLRQKSAISPTPTERKRKARDYTHTVVEYRASLEDDVARSEKKSKVGESEDCSLEEVHQYPFYDPVLHGNLAIGFTDPFYTPPHRSVAQIDPSQHCNFPQNPSMGGFPKVTDPMPGIDPAILLEDSEQTLRRALEQLSNGQEQGSQNVEGFEQAELNTQATMYNFDEAWSSPQAPMYEYCTSFANDMTYSMSQDLASLHTETAPMLDWAQTLNLNYNQALQSQVVAAGIG